MNNYLGDLEELVLMVVSGLNGQGYGVTICDALNKANRRISISATQATLTRLEAKGYISSELGDPTPERGGRRKKFYQVTGVGQRALADAEARRAKIRRMILATTEG